MGRVSQAQAQENRRRIVETAARMYREHGVSGVSVADVMAEVGLTHGGFYKHFASKEALVAEAVDQAYAEQVAHLGEFGKAGDSAARLALLDDYLSTSHRDSPGTGCPSAGFGSAIARSAPDAESRKSYAKGVEAYSSWMGGGKPDLAGLSTLVGAMILARATAGTELSERILAEAKAALADRAQ
jgi:TetR/AcrR family transcriptional repressor of nem operon